jgi:hypothetical protein
MVTFIDGELKNLYRHFRIRTIGAESGGDDFGMMLEMLKRRFSRGKEEGDLPELIVVAGKGSGRWPWRPWQIGIEGVERSGQDGGSAAAPRGLSVGRVVFAAQANPVV